MTSKLLNQKSSSNASSSFRACRCTKITLTKCRLAIDVVPKNTRSFHWETRTKSSQRASCSVLSLRSLLFALTRAILLTRWHLCSGCARTGSPVIRLALCLFFFKIDKAAAPQVLHSNTFFSDTTCFEPGFPMLTRFQLCNCFLLTSIFSDATFALLVAPMNDPVLLCAALRILDWIDSDQSLRRQTSGPLYFNFLASVTQRANTGNKAYFNVLALVRILVPIAMCGVPVIGIPLVSVLACLNKT